MKPAAGCLLKLLLKLSNFTVSSALTLTVALGAVLQIRKINTYFIYASNFNGQNWLGHQWTNLFVSISCNDFYLLRILSQPIVVE